MTQPFVGRNKNIIKYLIHPLQLTTNRKKSHRAALNKTPNQGVVFPELSVLPTGLYLLRRQITDS